MRLNAFLARAGVASRRSADELIKAGRVTINQEPGQLNSAISTNDIVKVDGKRVELQELKYVLLYKPAGYVTTLKDERGRRKVTDLIDIQERIVPVGRLDYDTTGALLLTNDGELAHKLMHPSFEIAKVYEATVEGQITDEKLRKLEQGVELEDGLTAPARARIFPSQGDTLLQGVSLQKRMQRVELTVHEGRKHQVKRMLAAVDLPVKKLHRSQYGPLNLDGLKPGQWRELTNSEIATLKNEPKFS